MGNGKRIGGDDLCKSAYPSGPPPTCPKMACHRALTIFGKDMEPEIIVIIKPKKKAAKK